MMEKEFNLLSREQRPSLVEKYNLMPRLGSWVVEQVIHHRADQKTDPRTSFFINPARSILIDSVFLIVYGNC